MRTSSLLTFTIILSLLIGSSAFAQAISLTPDNLEAINVSIEKAVWKGNQAVRLTETGQEDKVAIVRETDFRDGTIEIELAGQPAESAVAAARGFIGVAFRVQKEDPLRYEAFYLRPTNGRADDQVRRNHSTQYISHPEYTWYRLRQQFPGKYESYVDLVPGEWTKVKVVVKGKRAELYVHGAGQPCLVVTDLKQSGASGAIALWIGVGTEGYFRNLVVKAD